MTEVKQQHIYQVGCRVSRVSSEEKLESLQEREEAHEQVGMARAEMIHLEHGRRSTLGRLFGMLQGVKADPRRWASDLKTQAGTWQVQERLTTDNAQLRLQIKKLEQELAAQRSSKSLASKPFHAPVGQ